MLQTPLYKEDEFRLDYSTLNHDLDVVRSLLCRRLAQVAGSKDDLSYPSGKEFADPVQGRSPYDEVLMSRPFSEDERVVLLLAIATCVQANFFEALIYRFFPQGGEIPEIGGIRGTSHRGMLATGETAAFILAEGDIRRKFSLLELFEEGHFFATENILYLDRVSAGEPPLSSKIVLYPGFVEYLTTGKPSRPRFGPDFPARLLTTQMEWEDVVLNAHTRSQIDQIRIWLTHNDQLMRDWGMGKKIKRGYRALFFGPPGTGKTLVATLLGKHFQKEVYRIDISQVVSKYIGETEKNLEKIFTRAEFKNWIIFCDECDALFGKRMNVSNAHDKYANQEVSYLLQRIEDHPALIVLASNFKNNIDNAFLRRFNSVISFPLPTEEERLHLWQKSVPARMEASFGFGDIAKKFEMSGASILNVIHYAALRSLSAGLGSLQEADVLEGIRQEFQKEDRFFKA